MTFTASNGAIVHNPTKGGIAVGNSLILRDNESTALREFFQHERDEELGRWRWPENPDYVVYPDANDPRLVTVMRESAARIRKMRRGRDNALSNDYNERFGECADTYFEAHPERKPWRDAKCGDSWYLEPHGVVYDCVGNGASSEGLWFTRANVYGNVENVPLDDERIRSGRRIWPEDAS